MAVRLRALAGEPRGRVPAPWWPSGMQGNATQPALDRFAAIPGRKGIIRLSAPFDTTDFTAAVDLADFQARVDAYCAEILAGGAHLQGTCLFEIPGVPLFLSSSADATILGGSGWPRYRTARPADLSVGGAYQTAKQLLVHRAMNVHGLRAPRNPRTGRVEVGRPGVIFQIFNEPNAEVFWGFNGGAGLNDYFLCYQRFCAGALAANGDFAVAGPVVAGWASTRTDELYATDSADFFSFSGAPFAGGTEATGRRTAFATRSFFKFDPARIYDAPAALTLSLSALAPAGDVSADVLEIHPYAGDGQANPSADTGATRFNRCAAGTAYVSGNTDLRTSGVKLITLPAAAIAHLRAARAAGTSFSLGCWSPQETTDQDPGAPDPDHYFIPKGYNDADENLRPFLLVAYEKTLLQMFIEFVGRNRVSAPELRLDLIDVHNFQDTPAESTANAFAQIQESLSLAGLPLDTPVITTELQDHRDIVGPRDDYRSAGYLAQTLFYHRRAGFSALEMAALLKFGSAPSDPDLFKDIGGTSTESQSWGMITNGTVNGFYVSAPCFMLLQRFGLWERGRELRAETEEDVANSLTSFCVRRARQVFLVVGRGQSGPGSVDVELEATDPERSFASVRLYRFSPTHNNPKAVFDATVGTYAVKCQAALDAGNTPTFTDTPGALVSFAMGKEEAAVAVFSYAPQVPAHPAAAGNSAGGGWAPAA